MILTDKTGRQTDDNKTKVVTLTALLHKDNGTLIRINVD